MNIQDESDLTMSQRAVRAMALQNPAIQAGRGFTKALRPFIKRLVDEDASKEIHHLGFNPDAYVLDEDAREIVIYEIEDTHMLSTEKLDLLIEHFWWFDDMGLTLRLIVTDRYGMNRREISLHAQYLATPEAQAIATASPEAISWLVSIFSPSPKAE